MVFCLLLPPAKFLIPHSYSKFQLPQLFNRLHRTFGLPVIISGNLLESAYLNGAMYKGMAFYHGYHIVVVSPID